MYGLPSLSAGEIGAVPPAVGDLVVYQGSLEEAWGRYRVVAVTEHTLGNRYDLSPYRDDAVVLRGVTRRSIAVIPAGAAHRVDNPVGRIDAVLRRRVGIAKATDLAHVDQLPSTMLTLLALNRYVEAEAHLLHAEQAIEILSPAAFRHRIEQLRIRGNDESHLTQGSCMNPTATETDHGRSPGGPAH